MANKRTTGHTELSSLSLLDFYVKKLSPDVPEDAFTISDIISRSKEKNASKTTVGKMLDKEVSDGILDRIYCKPKSGGQNKEWHYFKKQT